MRDLCYGHHRALLTLSVPIRPPSDNIELRNRSLPVTASVELPVMSLHQAACPARLISDWRLGLPARLNIRIVDRTAGYDHRWNLPAELTLRLTIRLTIGLSSTLRGHGFVMTDLPACFPVIAISRLIGVTRLSWAVRDQSPAAGARPFRNADSGVMQQATGGVPPPPTRLPQSPGYRSLSRNPGASGVNRSSRDKVMSPYSGRLSCFVGGLVSSWND